MNLTQPPFDDIHVRKAMNWIMDKDALVQAWGGPTDRRRSRTTSSRTRCFNNQLAEYAPYRTPGDHGSVAKAKAAMKGSKYDTEQATARAAPAACKNVLLIVGHPRGRHEDAAGRSRQSAKKIGITFKVRTVNGAYPTIQTPSKNIPIAERPGWGKDYADPLTFFSPLFDGRTIIPNGNTNYSLVGITPAQCKKVEASRATCTNVPSVERGPRQVREPRRPRRTLACYEQLDKKLMTKVVPWVPYLWSTVTRITSKNVTKYEFDQFATTPAYAHIAVK